MAKFLLRKRRKRDKDSKRSTTARNKKDEKGWILILNAASQQDLTRKEVA
jgi:hypothetical protein